MTAPIFDDLQQTLAAAGPEAAIGQLCDGLRERGEYNSLFYARLLEGRHRLGANPVPTGPSTDLPASAYSAYEEVIRTAAREAGGLFLEKGDVPQAWVYFRMIGEQGPVREALEKASPGEDEDIQPLVHLAFYEGVHPHKGFDWILGRYGLCNAITTLSSHDMTRQPEAQRYCVERLVETLHRELRERLVAEVERHDGSAPSATATVSELIADRDWLFADEFYHVDVSHLGSVVQMSMNLPAGPALDLARELCAYGKRLSPRFQYPGDPPFEDRYHDFAVYLAVLAGDAVEEGLAHFRRKADEADPESVGTYPAEVLVNLLLKLGRGGEALAVSCQHLTKAQDRPLTCPGVVELCLRQGEFTRLAEVARDQGDAVHYLAGLLAARRVG